MGIAFVVVKLYIFKFSVPISILEMVLFGDFLGPNSPKYCPILMKFSPGVVFKKRKGTF